jgi:glycosyltransferase involved in cell wall biosynthesis
MSEISIVIPTINRAAQLARTLRSIARTVSAADPAEIIVVNNASTDTTEATYRETEDGFSEARMALHS